MTPISHPKRTGSGTTPGSRCAFLAMTHPRAPLVLGVVLVLGMMAIILLL